MKKVFLILMCFVLCFVSILPVFAAEYDEKFDVLVNIDKTKSTVLKTYEQRYYAIPSGYEHFVAYYDDFTSKYRICFYSGSFRIDLLDASDEYYWDYYYTHNGFYADKLICYSFDNIEDVELYLTNSYTGEIASSGFGTYTRLPCALSKFYFTDQELYFRVSQLGVGSKYDYLRVNDPVDYEYYLVRHSLEHYSFENLFSEFIALIPIVVSFLISFISIKKAYYMLLSLIKGA